MRRCSLCRYSMYETMALLGVEVTRVRRKTFWLANESRLEWIYADFCHATRRKLSELHPDHGGDANRFIAFRMASDKIHHGFHLRGIGRGNTLQHGLEAEEAFEAKANKRRFGPRFTAHTNKAAILKMLADGHADEKIVATFRVSRRTLCRWRRKAHLSSMLSAT